MCTSQKTTPIPACAIIAAQRGRQEGSSSEVAKRPSYVGELRRARSARRSTQSCPLSAESCSNPHTMWLACFTASLRCCWSRSRGDALLPPAEGSRQAAAASKVRWWRSRRSIRLEWRMWSRCCCGSEPTVMCARKQTDERVHGGCRLGATQGCGAFAENGCCSAVRSWLIGSGSR